MTKLTCMKEYRHIVCFIVLYKIISKILTNGLQVVLSDIINENQSAFIKERVIFYNIILSHELIKGYGRNISPTCMVKIYLQKANDSAEWAFNYHSMLFLDFPFQYVT